MSERVRGLSHAPLARWRVGGDDARLAAAYRWDQVSRQRPARSRRCISIGRVDSQNAAGLSHDQLFSATAASCVLPSKERVEQRSLGVRIICIGNLLLTSKWQRNNMTKILIIHCTKKENRLTYLMKKQDTSD